MSERDVVAVADKPWWQSKTMIFNVLVAALIAVEMNVAAFKSVLEPQQYAFLAMGINIVNVALRSITAGPVKLK